MKSTTRRTSIPATRSRRRTRSLRPATVGTSLRRPDFRGSPEDRLKNPLGARAIYFDEKYRIHGTNAPARTIGEDDIGFGCLYLSNEDVVELSDKTLIDARVVVME